nr:FixH family protein [uncultured Arsenicibacter sp.]
MKLHWGWGIGLLYGGFVAMIGVLVSLSMNQKIDLVTEKYYDEEIQYQQKIDRINRTRALKTPVQWHIDGNRLLVDFPDVPGKPTGTIHFYCPANSKNDRTVTITDQHQVLGLESLPKGHYKLQIDWKAGDQAYWNEGVVNRP